MFEGLGAEMERSLLVIAVTESCGIKILHDIELGLKFLLSHRIAEGYCFHFLVGAAEYLLTRIY